MGDKFPQNIVGVLSDGNMDLTNIKDTNDLLDQAGRLLDKACSHDILGNVIFVGEDGECYIASTEVVLAHVAPEYLHEEIDALLLEDLRNSSQDISVLVAAQKYVFKGGDGNGAGGHVEIGKRVGQSIYLDPAAIDAGRAKLLIAEERAYRVAIGLLSTSGLSNREIFDIVCITMSTERLEARFLKFNSVWDPHPHVVKSVVVNLKTKEVVNGQCNGQIYHRLETILDIDHPAWAYHDAVTRNAMGAGLYEEGAPSHSFGHLKHWMSWVEKRTGISYNDYLGQVEDFQLVYTGELKCGFRVLRVPTAKLAELDKIAADVTGPVLKEPDLIEVFTVKFADDRQMDLKVCNGEPPYVDPVLFEKDGGEVATGHVGDQLSGEHYIYIEDQVYRVLVLPEED